MPGKRRASRYAAIRRTAPVALVAIAGLAMRVWILRSSLGRVTSDDAITGIMAERILDGRSYAFFLGQSYGGSLEAYVTAGAFAVFGHSVSVLKAVPIALSAVTAGLLFLIADRAMGRREGVVAACVWWLFPAEVVLWSTRSGGYYGVLVVLGAGAILLALNACMRPSPRLAMTLGIVLGLGAWTSPQVVALAAVPGVWVAVAFLRHARERRRELAALCVGWFAGASPWLVNLLGLGWAGLQPHGFTGATSYASRLREFVRGVPTLFGVRAPLSDAWFGPQAMALGAVILVLVLLVERVYRTRTPALLMLGLAAAAAPFLVALSPYVTNMHVLRYYYTTGPLVALVAAAACNKRAVAVVMVASCGALSAVALRETERFADADEGCWYEQAPRDLGPLEDRLLAEGHRYVYAPYWTAYRLTFVSNYSVVAAPFDYARETELLEAVESSGSSVWIWMLNGTDDDDILTEQIDSLHVRYSTARVGDYAVYELARPVAPERIPALALTVFRTTTACGE